MTSATRYDWASRAVGMFLGWALWVFPLQSELVLFDDGRVLKVAAFEVFQEDQRIRLDLPGGGNLIVPLLRVARVLDDEIVPQETDEPTGPEDLDLSFSAAEQIPGTPFGGLIYDAAKRHSTNPRLVAAMVAAESAFDPQAVSHKGARGLLQLMPATAKRFGVESDELFEPPRNLEAGVGYLAWLIERFDGELPLVLAAYNAGEGTVERYGGVPPYRETRDYIARVYRRLEFEAR